MRVLVGLKLDLVQLGQAIDEIGDGCAEALGDLGFGDRGVFHHVVQQGCGDGLPIHAPFGERAGDGQRMGDIGFARKTGLPLVCLFAEVVGVEDGGDFVRFEIAQAIDKNPVGWVFVLIDGCFGRDLIRWKLPGVVGGGAGRVRGVRIHRRSPRSLRSLVRRDRG